MKIALIAPLIQVGEVHICMWALLVRMHADARVMLDCTAATMLRPASTSLACGCRLESAYGL